MHAPKSVILAVFFKNRIKIGTIPHHRNVYESVHIPVFNFGRISLKPSVYAVFRVYKYLILKFSNPIVKAKMMLYNGDRW